MDKKKALRFFVLLLVVAIGVCGWWYASKRDGQDETRLVLYGNVDIRETDLAFNNSEHVDQLLVQEGDRVRKGQLLAILHRPRMQAEVVVSLANSYSCRNWRLKKPVAV
jgi:HlyD family secretion protein